MILTLSKDRSSGIYRYTWMWKIRLEAALSRTDRVTARGPIARFAIVLNPGLRRLKREYRARLTTARYEIEEPKSFPQICADRIAFILLSATVTP